MNIDDFNARLDEALHISEYRPYHRMAKEQSQAIQDAQNRIFDGSMSRGKERIIVSNDNNPRSVDTLKDYTIVITRHPYDIAGMATRRAWDSCLRIDTKDRVGGSNKSCVANEIKYGVMAAYLIPNKSIIDSFKEDAEKSINSARNKYENMDLVSNTISDKVDINDPKYASDRFVKKEENGVTKLYFKVKNAKGEISLHPVVNQKKSLSSILPSDLQDRYSVIKDKLLNADIKDILKFPVGRVSINPYKLDRSGKEMYYYKIADKIYGGASATGVKGYKYSIMMEDFMDAVQNFLDSKQSSLPLGTYALSDATDGPYGASGEGAKSITKTKKGIQ